MLFCCIKYRRCTAEFISSLHAEFTGCVIQLSIVKTNQDPLASRDATLVGYTFSKRYKKVSPHRKSHNLLYNLLKEKNKPPQEMVNKRGVPFGPTWLTRTLEYRESKWLSYKLDYQSSACLHLLWRISFFQRWLQAFLFSDFSQSTRDPSTILCLLLVTENKKMSCNWY